MGGYETVDGFQYGVPMPDRKTSERLQTAKIDRHGFCDFPLLASKFIVGGTNATVKQAMHRNPLSVFEYRCRTEGGKYGVRIWRIK